MSYQVINKEFDKYWHLQMHLPEGKGGMEIDPEQMLHEQDPIIATDEWDGNQCRNFKTIDKGNIVLVRKGNTAIALCQIIGDNFLDETLRKKYTFTNFRKVRILAWGKDYKQPRSGLFSQGTFSLCGQHTNQYEYIDNWLKYMNKKSFTDKCANLLKTKHNIILQGAPGTGKTFSTAAIALDALGITDIDFTDHQAIMTRYDALQDERIFFTTFHQSLDYEDFVEGLKPYIATDEEGKNIGMTYEIKNGIFKCACNAVKADKSVVLIIDEINRGNISKIFGELITLLESDKRDNGAHPIKVTLPYSKTLFSVPGNLYIIGTMNTTDRSTGTLDYALRRRFAFITLTSDPSVINEHYDCLGLSELKDKAINLFNDMKSFIEDPKHLCGDLGIDDLMIGHSYFMASDENELTDNVAYEILPLISEYINDGILNVREDEKKEAFAAWSSLTPRQRKDDDGEGNQED